MTALQTARKEKKEAIAEAQKLRKRMDEGDDVLVNLRNTLDAANKAESTIQTLVEAEKLSEATQKEEIKKLAAQIPAEEDEDKPALVSKKPTQGIGTLIVNSQSYKDYLDHKSVRPEILSEAPVIQREDVYTSATFGTDGSYGAAVPGWKPESMRIPGLVVDYAFQTPMVIDRVPMGRTNSPVVKWMEETTHTNAAAERVEEGSYVASAFAFTENETNVKLLGHFVPITDESLKNTPAMEGILNNRLTVGLRRRISSQLLNGDGTTPNLRGILNTTGITSVATPNTGSPKIVDLIVDRMFSITTALTDANPNTIIMHPTDYKKILVAKDTTGRYINTTPTDSGAMLIGSLWGATPVVTTEMPANTFLVGDFSECMQFVQWGIEVEVGYQNDDFTKGKRTIRAGMATAFAVFRPKAFARQTATNNAT